MAAATSAGTVAGAATIGWRYAQLLIDPTRRRAYPERVVAADSRAVTLVRNRITAQPGTWGLHWADGHAVVGSPTVHGDRVVRPLLSGPVPPPGPVAFDAGVFQPGPTLRGLPYREVVVDTPAGGCPAWLVPATASTANPGQDWAVVVHGRGGGRREGLRILPTLHRAGLTVLLVTYRNDVDEGAPPDPQGHDHLGDTEWLDVEAALRYAVDHGAERVVLVGWSMGGAITGALLDRSPLARYVVGVVWDAPVTDWRAVLRRQARNRWLPPTLIRLVTALAASRIGIDFDRFDLRRNPPAVRPPTLILHSTQDTAVPVRTSRALAAAAARTDWPVRYVEVPAVEHTAAWNADPAAYEREVADFVREVLG